MKLVQKRGKRWFVVLIPLLHIACGSPLDVDVLAIDVTGPVTVSVSAPVDFEITATNLGSSRVVWGMGSSSCQFSLVVEGNGIDRQDISFRGCTADLVEQGLEPGESRTEVISWDGQISVSGVLEPLPAGEYRVSGLAGNERKSSSLKVRVVEP